MRLGAAVRVLFALWNLVAGAAAGWCCRVPLQGAASLECSPRFSWLRLSGVSAGASFFYSKRFYIHWQRVWYYGFWSSQHTKGVDSSTQLKLIHDLNRHHQIHFNLSLPGVNSRFNPFCCWIILGRLNSDLILCQWHLEIPGGGIHVWGMKSWFNSFLWCAAFIFGH